MWIPQDVNLPEELLITQKNHTLVVFAGAGVSMGAPASFPDFDTLAARVGAGALPRRDNEPADRYLGRLKNQGVQVHSLVQQMLSDPASRPTPLHYALIHLFGSSNSIRIVTTNFDRHFTTVCREEFGNAFDTYYAPALPLGRNFEGLVYLHGSIDKLPQALVLTDADFGQAYLTDGWATRFLAGMFAAYTVLFVGYSHNDPVMQYLARGLPPQTQRYALTSSQQEEHWGFLGITPVVYPLMDEHGNHSALTEAISYWGNFVRWGAFDHERKIREIAEVLPPQDPSLVDYILWSVKDPVCVRFFTRYAKDPAWMPWVTALDVFASLFQEGSCENEATLELAEWFAQNFVTNHYDQALDIIERHGRYVNPRLWFSITRQLYRIQNDVPSALLAQWIALLIDCAPRFARKSALGSMFGSILADRQYPQDAPCAILLFGYLTEPHLLNGQITTIADEFWLRKAWYDSMQLHLNLLAPRLLPIVTHHLVQAYTLVTAHHGIDEEWDYLGFTRRAIEPHDQDRHREGFDILIDAARDVIEWILDHTSQQGIAVVDQWMSTGMPLLLRLAVHGIAATAQMTPDAKLDWLLDRDLLYGRSLKHEVFQLLANAYPQATTASRQRLLQRILRGSGWRATDEQDQTLNEYEKYNVLVWLGRVAPDCGLVAKELAMMQESHPDFGPREHPDFDIWMSEGFWGEPAGPLDVTELLAKPPAEQIEFLLSFQGEEFRAPSRSGLLNTIEQAVAQDFDWGWNLAHTLRSREQWQTDLWPALIQGWQATELTADQSDLVLAFVADNLPLCEYDHPILDWLNTMLRKEETVLTGDSLSHINSVTDFIWERATQNAPTDVVLGDIGWLTRAINHPGGKIVQVWLHTLTYPIEGQSHERGLVGYYRDRFESVIAGQSYSAQMGRIVLASQIHLLFNLDPKWTQEQMLPLFDWDANSDRALQAWDGFLLWGHWRNEALLAVLLPYYEQSFAYVSTLLFHIHDRFCVHLADIAIYSTHYPTEDNWIRDFLLKATQESRALWATHVGLRLVSLNKTAATEQWQRWIHGYWQRRNQGIPLPLANEEKLAMLTWIVGLYPIFPAVVAMVSELPMPDSGNTDIYFKLTEQPFADDYPAAVVKLLTHLLQGIEQPFYFSDEVEKQLRKAAAGASPNDLMTACELLAKLGHPKAAELAEFLQQASTTKHLE